jgi:hypothetical protein
MRFFRHTLAEYFCSKQCGYHRTIVEPNLSPFHLIVAAIAAVPLWVLSHLYRVPWYHYVGIFGGELLLMFFAGILSNFVCAIEAVGTKVCKKCGAPMSHAGRHFDPLGSAKPDWSDIVIFVIFIGLNIAVWIALATNNL